MDDQLKQIALERHKKYEQHNRQKLLLEKYVKLLKLDNKTRKIPIKLKLKRYNQLLNFSSFSLMVGKLLPCC